MIVRFILVEITCPFRILPRIETVPTKGHFLSTYIRSFDAQRHHRESVLMPSPTTFLTKPHRFFGREEPTNITLPSGRYRQQLTFFGILFRADRTPHDPYFAMQTILFHDFTIFYQPISILHSSFYQKQHSCNATLKNTISSFQFFSALLNSMLAAPHVMSFYDTTPTGQILNRFSGGKSADMCNILLFF